MQTIDEKKSDDEVDLEVLPQAEPHNEYELDVLTAKQAADDQPPTLGELFTGFDPEEYPDTYKANNSREEQVLLYVENFRKQYTHLYRDRKPLFLVPKNEFGIEKFVCSTIKPTSISINDFLEWDKVSQFVSDYLVYRPLEPSYELPSYMYTPATVIRYQTGNCFEYSTLLCGLLTGVGYDAYVVSGYASREVCLYDETGDICPKMIKKEEPIVGSPPPPSTKYIVKPHRDLSSKYEIAQEEKRQANLAAEEAKRAAAFKELIRIQELPPEDPFFGLRVHSWVLVRAGQRDVPETFFIEPLSGQARPLDCPNYFGIESVWNQKNYWVCMQDCSEGVANLSYDLSNGTYWEFIFPSNERKLIRDDESLQLQQESIEDENEEDVEIHMDLPPSWVIPVCVTQAEYENRFPNGKKTRLYKKARLEQFGIYKQPDGLMERLSIFSDYTRQSLIKVIEEFANRKDKLYHREFDYITEWIVEYFGPGETRKLKEHHYKSLSMVPNNERITIYYWKARIDGLEKRIENTEEIFEYYRGRDDHMIYKYAKYSDQKKKFAPAINFPRPLQKMVLKFSRNIKKSAIEDISEVIFDNEDNKIILVYHKEEDNISADTREFVKPTDEEIKGESIVWKQEANYTVYLSDPNRKDKRKPEIYQMMVDLLKLEESTENKWRDTENEIQEMLMDRIKEETYSQNEDDQGKVFANLEVKIYDTKRNDKAVKHRQTLEKMAVEARLAKEEKVLDPFAPYLARLGFPKEVSKEEMMQMRDDCLNDLKNRLVCKANYMQTRLETEIYEVKRRQLWFQQNQVQLSKDDEIQYSKFLSEASLRITILKERIEAHKKQSHNKYLELEVKINSDPRITQFTTKTS